MFVYLSNQSRLISHAIAEVEHKIENRRCYAIIILVGFCLIDRDTMSIHYHKKLDRHRILAPVATYLKTNLMYTKSIAPNISIDISQETLVPKSWANVPTRDTHISS